MQNRGRRLLLSLLLAVLSAPSSMPQAAPANDIFSGVVTELTADSVTVLRSVRGKDPVTRRFALDRNTKIEGRLREKARVTVQFEGGAEEPVHALHIIVR